MNILDSYPVFENNQVLTSDQLNNLVKYLDQQNRLTRAQLIGIGAICGFNLKFIPKSGSQDNTLLISKGIGITSEGFLIAQSDCYTTRYRSYKLPKTVGDDPFTGKKTIKNIVLDELLSTDADIENDPEIKTFDEEFLKNKVVLLFLEIFDQDLKTCLAKSCDEIGQTRIFTIRKLLITTEDMDIVLQRLNVDSCDPTFPNKFELPVITIPRVNIKPDEPAAKDKSLLLQKYLDAVEVVKKDLLDAIKLTYTTYNPILKDVYAKDYFGNGGIIDNKVLEWDTYLNVDYYGTQYFYDFIKDLALAYDEFKNTAFELCNECLINTERFPFHLMLGLAIPDKGYNIDSTPYRNRFIHSPAYSIQKYLTHKARSLHQRMVSMIINFKLEYIERLEDPRKPKDTKVKPKKTINEIYIIPSYEKLSKISERSIPFYYDTDKGDLPLINYWNYDIEKRKLSDYILTYQHQKENSIDPIKNPLKFDLDKYSFLRIEGVLGKEANISETELNKKKVDFNLPFNVVTLILNQASDKLVLSPELWNDLSVSYTESHFRFKCLIQNLYGDIQKLENYNLEIEYTTIKSNIVNTLIDDILSCLPNNINVFNFPLFFDKYCRLIELMHEYRLVLTHLQGKLINVLINVIPAKDLQNKLVAIDESLDFINRILNNCTYKELYLLYNRLIGRKKYLKENHPMVFSNFIKKNPGIDHLIGVNKFGTYLMIIEDITPELDKNKVLAEFSLPYLCCCDCIELPTIEKELDYNQLPELALPDGAICIKYNKVDIDILQNDYIPYTGKFNITTNSQYAIYDSSKKLITYNRNSYLGLDTFHYTINRKIAQTDTSIQTTKNELIIVPDDLIANSLFGYSLDIDQGKAIIGALKGGDKSVNSGSAYILELIDGQWKQQAKLLPSDKENEDQFGCSVAISGNYAFVGAKGEDTNGSMAGSVYVFAFENKNWVEKQKLQPNDISAGDYFGCSIAIFNNLLIIGAFGKDGSVKNCGCAYLFKLEANKWVQKQKITASDSEIGDYFGYDVALYNNNLVIGAYCKDSKGYNSGCAYVYSYNGTLFIEKHKLIPNDLAVDNYFGSSVAIYENTIVVGARRNDISGNNSGSAYVFNYQQNRWVEIQKLVPFDAESGDYFGYSVDIYKDTILIGSRYEDKGGENVGAAYLFIYENGSWEQNKKVQPEKLQPNNLFGSAVGIYNDILIIGAHKSNGNAGSIYIFPKQIEIVNNIASVKVLVREEYKSHIQAFEDTEIVTQHDQILIDVLKNDIKYDTTLLSLPSSNSILGGQVSIIDDGTGKKVIRFIPNSAGKDSFKYQLTDNVRDEKSEATVTVFVTKLDLTIPDIVYLVTSVNQNSIPIALPTGWSISTVSRLPVGMGSMAIDQQNSALIFTPGSLFSNNKTLSTSYILRNDKNEPVKGILHLVSGLDEYSIPDIVFLVTKKLSNSIPIEFASQNGIPIVEVDTIPVEYGKVTISRTNTINFIPGTEFTNINTLKINYYLKKTKTSPTIKGVIHLVNGLVDHPIPDVIYQVTQLGTNIISIDYALQNKLEITDIISDIPPEIGTLTKNKQTITFETGVNYGTQNSLRFSYSVLKDGESIIGNVHLVNSIRQSEEYKDYFSEVMAGTIMAFAYDPINSYDVVLTSLGRDYSKVIDVLILITGRKPEDINALVASLPATIIKGTTLAKATDIAKQLTEYGATIETPDWLKQHGWLICDGKQYNRLEYSRLFDRIKILYGQGDGKNTFNVPDYRNQFLRGWDNNEKNPRRVSTSQADQIQSHKHLDSGHTHTDKGHYHSEYVVSNSGLGTAAKGIEVLGIPVYQANNQSYNTGWGYAGIDSGYASLGEPALSNTIAGEPRHGAETRPRNIGVIFCIKF